MTSISVSGSTPALRVSAPDALSKGRIAWPASVSATVEHTGTVICGAGRTGPSTERLVVVAQGHGGDDRVNACQRELARREGPGRAACG